LDDSEREGLQCRLEGGGAKSLSRLTLPSCGNGTQTLNAHLICTVCGKKY